MFRNARGMLGRHLAKRLSGVAVVAPAESIGSAFGRLRWLRRLAGVCRPRRLVPLYGRTRRGPSDLAATRSDLLCLRRLDLPPFDAEVKPFCPCIENHERTVSRTLLDNRLLAGGAWQRWSCRCRRCRAHGCVSGGACAATAACCAAHSA